MAKKSKLVKFLAIFGISIIFVVISIIVIVNFQPQIPLYLGLRLTYSPDKRPFAYISPKETLVVHKKGDRSSELYEISLGSMRVYVPDSGDITVKRVNEESLIIRRGEEAIMGLFMFNITSYKEKLSGLSDEDRLLYREIYGDEMFSDSIYEFQKAVIPTTPDSLSISSPPEDIIRANVLLLIKGAFGLPKSRGAYWIKIDDIPGFQIGSPSTGDDTVKIHLYPPDGKEYQILLTGMEQQEILDLLGLVHFES